MDHFEFGHGRGRIWTRDEARLALIPDVALIPDELATRLAQARYVVYEWTDYWITYSGAEGIRMGDVWAEPIGEGIFRLRLENYVGLAELQPFAKGRPIGSTLHVEVLSPKFATLEAYYSFLTALLDDLFAHAVRLPFAISAPTARGVIASLQPPTPLFTFHFLRQHADELRYAWNFLRARPHRLLSDHPAMVPLTEDTEVDADVLLSTLHGEHRWVIWG